MKVSFRVEFGTDNVLENLGILTMQEKMEIRPMCDGFLMFECWVMMGCTNWFDENRCKVNQPLQGDMVMPP